MTEHPRTCSRCGRRYRDRGRDSGEWNAIIKSGLVIAVICPDCQTPEENTEAVIRDATLIYSTDSDGRLRATPRA